ncbi:4'-phosphopantetheinyl transferase superfamily protein [Streptomyces sp. NPDC006516]|uniref:4'-phosphopantetheinyl transferase superfamily protein n=1 Tax=Streptomyces sp. NPDC006516 TaxID=3154309 RepID=UPI0033B7EF36
MSGTLRHVRNGRTDVWAVPGDPDLTRGPDPLYPSVLDDRERGRAAAFVRVRDRVQYVNAHLALRHLLSAYSGVSARLLRLGPPAHGTDGAASGGAPVVHGVSGAPRYSLSHSHGLILVAVAAQPVGVDVQRIPGPGTVDACLGFLHPRERAELAALPREGLAAAFAQQWARKEAYLKGLGTGLARSPRLDYVGARNRGAGPAGWHVVDIPVSAGYAAAVAVRSPAAPDVVLRSWSAFGTRPGQASAPHGAGTA